MSLEFTPNLGGHPERMKSEGVKIHYNELAKIGESVESIANISNEIPKGTILVIKDIIIEPKDGERGFYKRMVFEGMEGEFNPKNFKKI